MSRKYVVFADVDGEMKMLSLLSNAPRRAIRRLSRELAEKFFANRTVHGLWVEPWPAKPVRVRADGRLTTQG